MCVMPRSTSPFACNPHISKKTAIRQFFIRDPLCCLPEEKGLRNHNFLFFRQWLFAVSLILH